VALLHRRAAELSALHLASELAAFDEGIDQLEHLAFLGCR